MPKEMPAPVRLVSTSAISAARRTGPASAKALGLALVLAALSASAADWPQWRGPNRNGSTTDTGVVTPWPATGPKKAWEYKIGGGHSSLVVSGKRLFTNVAGPKKDGSIVCLDALTGELLWKYPFPSGNGVNATPSADGKFVVSISDSGYLAAVDVETGKAVWGQDLMKDFGVAAAKTNELPPFASPIIAGDLVIVNSGFAFAKADGKLAWKAETAQGRRYVSPVLFPSEKPCAVEIFTGTALVGVNLSSGAELSSLALKPNAYADPTVLPDALFYEGAIMKVDADKPVLQKQRVPFGAGLANPVLWDKHLYASCGGWSSNPKPDSYTLKCLDMETFAEKWSQKGIWGPLIAVDGKLLIVTALGEVVVVKASPEKFEELARAPIYDAAKNICWATPAFANGKFYMRSNGFIACLDLAGK